MGEIIRAGKARVLQRAAPGRNHIGEAKRRCFLDTLAATCNVALSAEAAGVTKRSLYRMRMRDEGFAHAWQAALTIGYHRLEEALLAYTLSRVEADGIDPDNADPAATRDSMVRKLDERRVSTDELRFALALLNRHCAAAEGRRRYVSGVRRATAEETDAALLKQLAILGRQRARHGA